MEYYANKEKDVAFKIFEVGLKNFGSDIDFVSVYLDHLIAHNDDGSMHSYHSYLISFRRASFIWADSYSHR